MSSLLLKLSLYSAVINIAIAPFSADIAKLFGYATIIMFLLSATIPVFSSAGALMSKNNISMILLVSLTFFISLGALIGKKASDIVDTILPILAFIAFYISLDQKQQKSDKLTLNEVFYANYALCFILMLFAFGPFDFKYEVVNKYDDKIFTLGLGNPNAVSLSVMFCVVILFVQIFTTEKIAVKVINIIVSVVLFYILYLLASRTVLFCAIIVALAFLFKTPKAFKLISYFVLIVPIIMIWFQLWLFNSKSAALQILGKSISTGRPDMYKTFIQKMQDTPIKIFTGDLCTYAFENLHNGLLTILASLGIFGVILYMLFWNRQLGVLRKACVDRKQKIAFVAILAILVHASSEAMGIVGTIPYSVFVVIIMRIAKGDIEVKK